ncbi:nucleotide sugar dehydrogenase [bacterium]|nr:nucleotide sugar dehydrogenase [bacterium]
MRPFTEENRKLGIVGQGYVGLPLAEAFARAGVAVLGFDVDADKVACIMRGESYVGDVSSANLKELVDLGMIEATTDFDRLRECGAISICVPTPLSKSKEPDVSYIEQSVTEICRSLQPGQLIVLESTSYPGTTDELVLPRLEETGLKVGEDFFLAFSPERVDPGNPNYGVKNTPKIIGGVTAACTERAVALYQVALDHVHPVSSTVAAEMVKLLENTFRAINIGFVNELAQMCKRLNVDVWEVVEAAATKPFGYMPFYPGPGLGGHCIPIDPIYLSWKMSRLNYKAQFIDLADTINAGMPDYVVTELMDQLNERQLALNGSKILILGMAYKENISDIRESPALDVVSLLMAKGAEVCYHDPHVPSCRVDGRIMENQELTDELLKSVDLAVIITAHEAIDYERVVKLAPQVFDAKNATGKRRLTGGANIRRL